MHTENPFYKLRKGVPFRCSLYRILLNATENRNNAKIPNNLAAAHSSIRFQKNFNPLYNKVIPKRIILSRIAYNKVPIHINNAIWPPLWRAA